MSLAAQLEKARVNGQWGSTLSNAAALAALARYQVLVQQEKPDFTGTITFFPPASVVQPRCTIILKQTYHGSCGRLAQVSAAERCLGCRAQRRYAIGVWVGRFRGTGEVAFVGARASEPLLARLFDLPILRANADPAPPQPIPVRHPLPPPPELADAVWIVSPGNGEKFIALDGKTAVLPRAKGQGKLAWFLDGLLLAPSQTARLILPPGRYKLRCVDMAGRSSAVTFLVL